MPKWIHDRAEHILAKNPSMPKSQAFAIATQQSHALGKSPKSWGTEEGREKAKAKYKTPSDDKKTANPGNLKSEKMAMNINEVTRNAFFDELLKIGTVLPPMHPRGMNAGVHSPAPAPGAPTARPAAGRHRSSQARCLRCILGQRRRVLLLRCRRRQSRTRWLTRCSPA